MLAVAQCFASSFTYNASQLPPATGPQRETEGERERESENGSGSERAKTLFGWAVVGCDRMRLRSAR